MLVYQRVNVQTNPPKKSGTLTRNFAPGNPPDFWWSNREPHAAAVGVSHPWSPAHVPLDHKIISLLNQSGFVKKSATHGYPIPSTSLKPHFPHRNDTFCEVNRPFSGTATIDFHPRDANRHGVSGGPQGCAQGKTSSATFACSATRNPRWPLQWP